MTHHPCLSCIRGWSGGALSLNLRPGAWCLSPLGCSDTDYLSHGGTNTVDSHLGGLRLESMRRLWSPDSVPTHPAPPGGGGFGVGAEHISGFPRALKQVKQLFTACSTHQPQNIRCVQGNSPRPIEPIAENTTIWLNPFHCIGWLCNHVIESVPLYWWLL